MILLAILVMMTTICMVLIITTVKAGMILINC